MEASKVTKCPDERQDLCEDNLQEPAPAPHDNLADQLTSDIQKDPPKAKKPRTKAQQEAFAKAQRALKEKRELKAKESKQSPVKPKPKAKKQKPAKKVVYEVDESDDSSSSDEEVVYVQRKKPRQKKPKQKKPPRVVYVTDSEDEDEVMEDAYETPQPWYNFV